MLPAGPRKRLTKQSLKVGCEAWFTVAVPFAKDNGVNKPADYATITYRAPNHTSPGSEGQPCHGPNASATTVRPRHRLAPWLSDECRDKVRRMHRVGVKVSDIVKRIKEWVMAKLGFQIPLTPAQKQTLARHRDFLITRADVHNIVRGITSATYKYDERDPYSVHAWAFNNPEWCVPARAPTPPLRYARCPPARTAHGCHTAKHSPHAASCSK